MDWRTLLLIMIILALLLMALWLIVVYRKVKALRCRLADMSVEMCRLSELARARALTERELADEIKRLLCTRPPR